MPRTTTVLTIDLPGELGDRLRGFLRQRPGQSARDIAIEALEALGSSSSDVVRTRMYIVDPADADAIGTVHAEAFGEPAPAATMVVVAGLLDPTWKVEIEVEAIVR